MDDISHKTNGDTSIWDLPHDILVDILLRLPIKSLLRLRCASKFWHSLITSPMFIDRQIKQSKSNPTFVIQPVLQKCSELFFMEQKGLLKDIEKRKSPTLIPCARDLDMVGSCNGLDCIESIESRQICIYNPATRESAILPDSISSCMNMIPEYGFGFDVSSKEYKVVRVKVKFHIECDIFADKAFHWILDSNGPQVIPSMDISDEKLKEIKLPEPHFKSSFDDYILVEFKESLSLFRFFLDGRTEIWILKDHKNCEFYSS
ncbi:F-box protein At3g07870-like [Tasmannia lanceolata]|uniref:F-box protein At3g07870-like n=1 Tax=Tasmannia lanceolata TaxID=3420 RepID=UPI004062ACDD